MWFWSRLGSMSVQCGRVCWVFPCHRLTVVSWVHWGLSSCAPSFQSLLGERNPSSPCCSGPCRLWPCPRNTSYHWQTEPETTAHANVTPDVKHAPGQTAVCKRLSRDPIWRVREQLQPYLGVRAAAAPPESTPTPLVPRQTSRPLCRPKNPLLKTDLA